MIAMTVKNGNSVRLTADHHIDTERVDYEVYSEGYTFRFADFAPAARVYKDLSRLIEGGENPNMHLKRLASGARVMGYEVKEPNYAKEVA